LDFDTKKPLVTKSGGSTDLVQQAEIMHRGGPEVFAAIYGRRADCYTMEQLLPQPAPLDYIATWLRLLRIRHQFLPRLWAKAPIPFPREVPWQVETDRWTQLHAPWLQLPFRALYNNARPAECLVHGDPTLSNTMLNGALELRLIDPAPPRYGVPQLPEVDLGKLLQSAMGWEHLFCDDWPQAADNIDGLLHDLTTNADLPERLHLDKRALWWGAFHCARVMVRYPDDSRLANWGLAASTRLAGML
jgi:hypothetical protein